MKKTKIIAILLACFMSLSLGLFMGCKSEEKDTFKQFYEETCGSNGVWAKLSTDEKTLTMDTKPYDGKYDHVPGIIDDNYNSEVLNAIEILHEEFNIPSYVYEQLMQTSSADGKQTYQGENIVVWWTYSSAKGLEITYGLK